MLSFYSTIGKIVHVFWVDDWDYLSLAGQFFLTQPCADELFDWLHNTLSTVFVEMYYHVIFTGI